MTEESDPQDGSNKPNYGTGLAGVRNCLADAMGGVANPGVEISYYDVLLKQSRHSPAVWHLFVDKGDADPELARMETLNIYAFKSTGEILDRMHQRHDEEGDDSDDESADPKVGRGFQ